MKTRMTVAVAMSLALLAINYDKASAQPGPPRPPGPPMRLGGPGPRGPRNRRPGPRPPAGNARPGGFGGPAAARRRFSAGGPRMSPQALPHVSNRPGAGFGRQPVSPRTGRPPMSAQRRCRRVAPTATYPTLGLRTSWAVSVVVELPLDRLASRAAADQSNVSLSPLANRAASTGLVDQAALGDRTTCPVAPVLNLLQSSVHSSGAFDNAR